MRTSTLPIAMLSLALCVSAALQPFLRVPAISAAELTRRQVSIGSPSPVPSQCTPTCNPVNDEINLVSAVCPPRVGVAIPMGCPVTACCTTTFETQYYNCLECVGMALDASNYSTAQYSLNLLYTTCVDMGFVLPRLELPGQTDNSTSSASASPTGSSGTIHAIGAAVGRWHRGMLVEALIGAAVLLGVTALW